MKRVTVLLADDHDVVLAGLREILNPEEFEVVGAVKDGRALVRAAETLQPDVVVADITMPSLNGIEAARQIATRRLNTKIVFLTMHPEVAYATEALAAGGSGYVLKTSAGEELPAAIREVMKQGIFVTKSLAEPVIRALESRSRGRVSEDMLTPRQREVLQLLVEGRSVKEIAAALSVSPRTAEFHKYRIMQQLGVGSVAELASYAVRHGIVK